METRGTRDGRAASAVSLLAETFYGRPVARGSAGYPGQHRGGQGSYERPVKLPIMTRTEEGLMVISGHQDKNLIRRTMRGLHFSLRSPS